MATNQFARSHSRSHSGYGSLDIVAGLCPPVRIYPPFLKYILGLKYTLPPAMYLTDARVWQLAVAERAGRDGSRKSSKFCDLQHSVTASHGVSQGTHRSSIVPICHRISYCQRNLTLPSPLGAKSDAWIAICCPDTPVSPVVWASTVLPSTARFRWVDRTITCPAAVRPCKSPHGILLDPYARLPSSVGFFPRSVAVPTYPRVTNLHVNIHETRLLPTGSPKSLFHPLWRLQRKGYPLLSRWRQGTRGPHENAHQRRRG